MTMKNLVPALFKAQRRLNHCEAFRSVCGLVASCPYIDAEAVGPLVAGAVDAFAAKADCTDESELARLISLTDPRAIYWVKRRLEIMLDFLLDLDDGGIPLGVDFMPDYPIRAALIDVWRVYRHITDDAEA